MYGASIGDTGRFLFPSTSPNTFHYAAELVKYNFDRSALYNRLYDVPDKIARMRGYILQNYELSESGAVSVKVTQEILDKFDVDSTETAGLVGILGDIQGRSEEHTSELQSRGHLVCRLLLEKKKIDKE